MRVQEGLCVLLPMLSCCECDVISLYFMCCSVNGSCELRDCQGLCLFGETIRNMFGEIIRNMFGEIIRNMFGETICTMFGCGCYFVVECYGSV